MCWIGSYILVLNIPYVSCRSQVLLYVNSSLMSFKFRSKLDGRSARRHPCSDAGTLRWPPISTSGAHTLHPSERIAMDEPFPNAGMLSSWRLRTRSQPGLHCWKRRVVVPNQTPRSSVCTLPTHSSNRVGMESTWKFVKHQLWDGPGRWTLSIWSLSHSKPRHLESGPHSVEHWGWRRTWNCCLDTRGAIWRCGTRS